MFPPLREYSGLAAPIFVMLREHGEIWDTIDAIEAHLGSDPERGHTDEICCELLDRLERHNPKEEAVIYPQAEIVLSAEADARLRAFLEAEELPKGWVCERAGSH